MDFKKISNEELNLRLEKLARSERKLTHVILLHINEVDSRDLHLKMGYESLFSYLVKALHYSESAAYRRLQAARLLKTNPKWARAITTPQKNVQKQRKATPLRKNHQWRQGLAIGLRSLQKQNAIC